MLGHSWRRPKKTQRSQQSACVDVRRTSLALNASSSQGLELPYAAGWAVSASLSMAHLEVSGVRACAHSSVDCELSIAGAAFVHNRPELAWSDSADRCGLASQQSIRPLARASRPGR